MSQQEEPNMTVWKKLKSFEFTRFTKPIFINSEEFTVCPAKHHKCKGDAIWKYNIKQHEWIKVIDYDEDLSVYSHSAAFDSNNNCIYIFRTTNGNQIKCDLNSKKLSIIENAITPTTTSWRGFESSLRMLHVNDRLHCIGGNNRNQSAIHCSWSTKGNALSDKIMHKLPESITTGLRKHSMIYLKSQQCILVFGGRYQDKVFDTIYKYSIVNQKWIELDIKMPRNMCSFGIVKTREERFIILFGGSNLLNKLNEIYIYDTMMNAWSKSSVTTPIISTFRAAISNNDSAQDEKLCFGYIRNCYNEDEFIDLQALPYYLIKFISKWVSNEDIYLIQTSNTAAEAEMWTMNIDSILQNTV